jgi:hypothetical protein
MYVSVESYVALRVQTRNAFYLYSTCSSSSFPGVLTQCGVGERFWHLVLFYFCLSVVLLRPFLPHFLNFSDLCNCWPAAFGGLLLLTHHPPPSQAFFVQSVYLSSNAHLSVYCLSPTLPSFAILHTGCPLTSIMDLIQELSRPLKIWS